MIRPQSRRQASLHVAAIRNWKFYATTLNFPADFEVTTACQVYESWIVGDVETAWDDAGPASSPLHLDRVPEAPTWHHEAPLLASKSDSLPTATAPLGGLEFQI
ncbi:uncharacterized protein TRIVIDRAFT_228547 [Trichoderma virens Gv29-8]|uniref:Uncharacterized protein n=1 Tax=Hypocrea virens (strain Gv29-8 / FGSC 10586) TaxID=413071 RepID=G9NCU5_HYPVG|nr:uncharacterized protein TRIVIDRAFT_228547 [Trichoderma virens Gv29-8]EHK15517.1 hypothetical protein TRIVIDRAFT_228547 [Trichoderma virens Gv29-8]UKZ51463.1 hypothetical protein TrVGV298_005223 [Trichoderma virens]